jgi:hypothetical protein
MVSAKLPMSPADRARLSPDLCAEHCRLQASESDVDITS